MIKIKEYLGKDNIKSNLSLEQIKFICTSLGANPIENNNGLAMETICHNLPGESHGKKLYYYENSNLFKCYTECDDTFDIFDLVIKAKKNQENLDLNFGESIKYIINILDLDVDFTFSKKEEIFNEDLGILSRFENLNVTVEDILIEYKIYDDKILSNLPFLPPEPWIKEGISKETMNRYNIKYYAKDHKVVIPHYNIENQLIGIRGRSLVQEDIEKYGKYMPLRISKMMYTHPLSINLYGLNLNLNNINQMKKIIIFEGEKSVLLYESLFGGINNFSVASCGSSISLAQISLIRKYCKVDEVIIAYDKQFKEIGDGEFKKHTQLLMKLSEKFNNDFLVTAVFDKYNLLDYKDAPIDKGKDIFMHLFKNRVILKE